MKPIPKALQTAEEGGFLLRCARKDLMIIWNTTAMKDHHLHQLFTDQQKKRCVHSPITFTQTLMDKHINIHAKFKPKLITALAIKKKLSCHCVVLDHAQTIQSLLPFLGWSTLTLGNKNYLKIKKPNAALEQLHENIKKEYICVLLQ